MKGDFTKFTHKAQNHFNRLYKQQGRVELDSDFNEAADLFTHLNRTEAIDVIGKVGVPKGDSFKIDVVNNNTDLMIYAGRMYIDGILCVLESNILYRTQPDWLPQPAIAPVLDRKDLVYLHVMERHITWVEDNTLLESALQGVDTCTRVRTIPQVKIQTGIPATSTCGSVANWPPAPSGGLLSTGVAAVAPAPNPCVLPETAGFRGLENRLYRVEVHTGGDINAATFKWSRDNGAVVVPVEFINGQPTRVRAQTLGRDQVVGLKPGDWVELTTEQTDLTPASGILAQIVSISTDLVVELSKNIGTLMTHSRPKLRKWDQGSDAITITAGNLPVEDAITLSFSGNNFQAGDAWMFTARVGGEVETLVNAPPVAIQHHYAPLAIITWVPDPNNPGQLIAQVDSCRPQFPPLTAITASDVSFDGNVCAFGPNVKTVQQAIDALCAKQEECCTVVVRPGPDWTDVFATIPAAGAHLCFRPGAYTVDKKVVISKKGTIIISGAGDASKVTALNDECTLRFEDCNSITIRDFSAEGTVPQLGSLSADGILGAISIKNASDVLVENCRFTSADGPHRTTACLSVHTANHVSVRDNRFLAGVQQVGVLLSNVNNAHVEGNIVTGRTRTVGSMTSLLNDLQFIASVRLRLISDLTINPPNDTVPLSYVRANVGGHWVRFRAPSTHVDQWINLLAQNPMAGNPSAVNVEDHVLGLANQILKTNPFPSFSGIRATILGNTTPGAQGITVGGTVGDFIKIRENRISGFIQGIHVGLSAPNPNISTADRVLILDNHISVTLGTGSTRGRHGIYVGNARSLQVRGNRLALVRPTGAQNMQIDGIRVFGYLGRHAIIRENFLEGYNIGVHFELRGTSPSTPMWMINDNIAQGSNPVVSAPNAANKTNNWG